LQAGGNCEVTEPHQLKRHGASSESRTRNLLARARCLLSGRLTLRASLQAA
jgi:hypothetical protein